jgi:hypothetical protein
MFKILFVYNKSCNFSGIFGAFSTPISNGKYTYASTDIVIATVVTDEGVQGHGWALPQNQHAHCDRRE